MTTGIIGQDYLTQRIQRMGINLPRFMIIHGPSGSGKKTIAAYIAKQLAATPVICDNKVDSVREVIDGSYRHTIPTLYIFPDADKMSPAAKNALLKITEEPPQQAYFVMTVQDISSVLPTLKSRATVFQMDGYTPLQLSSYAGARGYVMEPEETKVMWSVCTVPGDIDILARYNIGDFFKFVQKVVDNIGEVNTGNALKVTGSLNTKEGSDGWDITIFLRAVMMIYRHKMNTDPDPTSITMINPIYLKLIKTTSKYISQLNITGVHKASLVDAWILEVRDVIRNGEHDAVTRA